MCEIGREEKTQLHCEKKVVSGTCKSEGGGRSKSFHKPETNAVIRSKSIHKTESNAMCCSLLCLVLPEALRELKLEKTYLPESPASAAKN